MHYAILQSMEYILFVYKFICASKKTTRRMHVLYNEDDAIISSTSDHIDFLSFSEILIKIIY